MTVTPPLKVGWLELFYDLVYVTLVAAVTHRLHGDPSPGRLAATFGLLAVVWTLWFNEVQAVNLARGISPRIRGFVLVSMAGVAVMAIGVPGLAVGDYLTFVLGYGLARTAMSPVWIDQRRLTGIEATRSVLVGPLVIVAGLMTTHLGREGWFWVALVVLELALAAQRPRRRDPATGRRLTREQRAQRRRQRRDELAASGAVRFDSGHLLERIGLFVMICFGESVAQLVAAMSDHRDPARWVLAGLGLGLVGLLFWCFYDVALDRVEHALEQAPERLREVLGFGQLAVVAGVLGVAAGLAAAIEHGSGHLAPSALQLVGGGTALLMLGLMSMSMDALRILITTAMARSDWHPEPDSPGQRRARLLLTVLNLGMALAGPAIVLARGTAMPGWVVIVVLMIGPAAFLLSGSRRGGPDRAPRDAPEPT